MSVHRTVENVYIRQEAVQLTRKHFWRLLVMTVIINVITKGLNVALTALGDELMIPEIAKVIDQYTLLVNSDRITSSEPLLNAMSELFTSPKFILFNLVCIVVTGLVSAGLTLGHKQQLLDTGRGGYPVPLRILRGMKRCPKAWGVQLWSGLKAIFWCLPGLGLMIVGGTLADYMLPEVSNVIMVIGMTLMLTLSFRALLRYVMAPYILADEPDRGVRDCVKLSIALMQGRLWQFIKVGIPAFFKYIGASILGSIVFQLLYSLFPMDAQITVMVEAVLLFAATIYFIEQWHMVEIVFYLRIRHPVPLEGVPRPVSDWLLEHTETDIEPDVPEFPDNEAAEAASEDIPETNEEVKETNHE